MKKFYLSSDGLVSRHKMRGAKLVGFGILHKDQTLVAYITDGRKEYFSYSEVKVGAHFPSALINLKDKEITKIDIITKLPY